MRPTTVISLLVAGLMAAAAVLVGPQLFSSPEAPMGTWDVKDEIAVATADPVDPALVDSAQTEIARQQLLPGEDDLGLDERTALVLRGRVVDRFHRPVAAASIWLDFGRGGPRGDRGQGQRRVPDPVQSDADGRFAFQGQTFRNLRITLLVVHRAHAPTSFERNLGEVAAETDLGELTVAEGGELIGRVTDLDGNGVPGAEVRLQPDNDNRMRFRREQALLEPATVDNNGYYRLSHVASGDWRIAATAPHHQNGASDPLAVAEDQRLEVADIRLGPGYELTGIVSDAQGTPIAEADVNARARWEPGNADNGGRRGGRGGPGASGPGGPAGIGGTDLRTRTNAQGRFFLEHLPGTKLEVAVKKDGYLNFQQNDVDAKSGQPLYVTLQDGLRIGGTVTSAATSSAVTRFQVTTERLRGLPSGNGANGVDWAEAMRQMRDGNLDDAARQELRNQMEAMRRQVGDAQGGPATRGAFRGNRQHKYTEHTDGRFRETGLQEGIYVVVVESSSHAIWRSAELELRLGGTPPDLSVTLLAGLTVRGIVRDSDGLPIAGADIDLRIAEDAATEAAAQGQGGGGRGRRGGGPGGGFRQLLNGLAGAVVSTTTDRAGQFALEHATAGHYRVTATAKGHSEARTDAFDLATDKVGVELTLESLGRLTGRVLGATPEQLAEVRVVAVPTGEAANLGAMFRGNGRPFATVTPDGTYRLDDLAPGPYAVRAFLGNGMRDMFTQFANGELLANVTVRANATANFDVSVTLPQSGTVRGSVLHNGAPASGFHVGLRRTDDGGAADPFGGGQGRRGGFGGGRDLNATVDGQGQFKASDVPAGTYQLTVSGDRRSGALHTETVEVRTQGTAEVTISLSTSAVEGQVLVADGTPNGEIDGNVVLLPGATEVPEDPAELRRNNSAFRARVADGRFSIEMLPPGNYLAVLTIRGRERSSLQVFAAIGQRSSVTIPAGAKTAPDAGPGGASGTGSGAGGSGAGGSGAGGQSSQPRRGGGANTPGGSAPTPRPRRGQ